MTFLLLPTTTHILPQFSPDKTPLGSLPSLFTVFILPPFLWTYHTCLRAFLALFAFAVHEFPLTFPISCVLDSGSSLRFPILSITYVMAAPTMPVSHGSRSSGQLHTLPTIPGQLKYTYYIWVRFRFVLFIPYHIMPVFPYPLPSLNTVYNRLVHPTLPTPTYHLCHGTPTFPTPPYLLPPPFTLPTALLPPYHPTTLMPLLCFFLPSFFPLYCNNFLLRLLVLIPFSSVGSSSSGSFGL